MNILVWAVGLINALVGLLVYIDPNYFSQAKITILLFSFVSLLLYINYFSSIFLYQLRIIFLAAIGYYSGIAKSINPDMLFIDFGISVQTFSVGVKMYGITSIALLGAAIGFALTKVPTIQPRFFVINKPMPWQPIFWLSGFLSIIIGFLSAKSYGPPVWEGSYASGDGEGQLLGNLQSIGVILMSLNVLAAMRLRQYKLTALSFIVCVYVLGFGILIRGGRLEFLGGLLALFVGIPAAVGKRRRVTCGTYILLITAALMMEVFGNLRSSLTTPDAETILEGYSRMFDSGIFFTGTVSGIASSFANVVHMIDHQIVAHQLGTSYFEYLLRTPPEFLYPNRPKDFSAIFDDYGYISIGGFFELAEAYINFGIAGVFIVPLVISHVIAYVYKRALVGNLFFYVQLIAILSVFMRGAWYQTFAYYKASFTGMFIFFGINILININNIYFKSTNNKNTV